MLRNGETQTATATLDNTEITFSINNINAEVNNILTTMDVPARLVNGKTIVPLRFSFRKYGYTVEWDADSRTADNSRIKTKHMLACVL